MIFNHFMYKLPYTYEIKCMTDVRYIYIYILCHLFSLLLHNLLNWVRNMIGVFLLYNIDNK